MTTEEIIYALWRKLEGGFIPDDSKYTYRELRLYARGAIAETLRQDYFNQLNADEYRYAGDSIAVKYKLTVSTDVDSGLKMITLPQTQVNVPAGLRNVNITSLNPVSLLSTTFIPVRVEEVFVGELQDPIPCVVLYYQEGDQITFYNGDFDDAQVRVSQKYSLPSSDTADIGVSEETLPSILTIAQRLLQTGMLPSDKVNDGAPTNS